MRKKSDNLVRSGILVFLFASFLLIVPPIQAQENLRIIFLHHSSGSNLIAEGNVREGLSALAYEFFDHGYNGEGLCLANGACPRTDYAVPGDNTDPDGIAAIFAQPLHAETDNTFSSLMQYDVIMFKSCFPTSNIASDGQLDEYMAYYLTIRDRMDQYPDKIFIVVTQPPQVPGSSNRAEAGRARQLAQWLSSDDFLEGHLNVFTFDFFGYLAAEDNFLRKDYRVDNQDAHPNNLANREIGPQFVSFIDSVIRSYRPDVDNHAVVPTSNPREQVTTDPPLTEDEGETPNVVIPDDADQADDQDGGTGSLPCPGMTLPLAMLAAVMIVKHDRYDINQQGEDL